LAITLAGEAMIDEDAFGILFSYYEVEDDEYGSDERELFVQRFEAFEQLALLAVQSLELPADHHVVCLGHALYAEVADREDTPQLLSSFRAAAARLSSEGFVNVAVLAHGSRWVEDGRGPELSVQGPSPTVARISRPSEPLRRALFVAALAQGDEHVAGWGPGVYADTEALEALGKTPKNAPTILRAPGAQFFRVPALRVEAS
jgi:hypothetical protein